MSTGNLAKIPLIDLSPYFVGDSADKRRVADEISRACERIGFFILNPAVGVTADHEKAL